MILSNISRMFPGKPETFESESTSDYSWNNTCLQDIEI